MTDLTNNKGSRSNKRRINKRKVIEDSDSDLELMEGSISQGKRRRDSSPASDRDTRGKGHVNSGNDGPSDAVIATWKRGDDDLEPSTKMLALMRYSRVLQNVWETIINLYLSQFWFNSYKVF